LIRPTYELAAAHQPSLVVAHPLAYGARVAEERLGVRTATLLLSPAILRTADSWVKRSVRWCRGTIHRCCCIICGALRRRRATRASASAY
jgi:hypothetical protein